uniref:Uncharacterized protein n=1 Tax=Erwinia amylovora ATCC BAA-2158 TaxID=889211 RepID=E5B7A7_ERWAM|nr:hypothetical protein predicted by Glimmer/Critica [Erwinia amylovora ATCC BAA-2158]
MKNYTINKQQDSALFNALAAFSAIALSLLNCR